MDIFFNSCAEYLGTCVVFEGKVGFCEDEDDDKGYEKVLSFEYDGVLVNFFLIL